MKYLKHLHTMSTISADCTLLLILQSDISVTYFHSYFNYAGEIEPRYPFHSLVYPKWPCCHSHQPRLPTKWNCKYSPSSDIVTSTRSDYLPSGTVSTPLAVAWSLLQGQTTFPVKL